MTIFKKYGTLECGINDDGDLFLGDNSSGYNLPDSIENREYILSSFDYEVSLLKKYEI